MKCHVHLNSIHFPWCDIIPTPSYYAIVQICKKCWLEITCYTCTVPLNHIYTSYSRMRERGCNPGEVEFLGSGDCFDAPSYILYLFVVNVENKIHMVNITCWLQLKYKHNLLILHESNIWSWSRSVGHGHIYSQWINVNCWSFFPIFMIFIISFYSLYNFSCLYFP